MQRYNPTSFSALNRTPNGDYILYADHQQAVAQARHALLNAKLQIEYLHGKFAETGSGNYSLTQISEALAALSPTDSGK